MSNNPTTKIPVKDCTCLRFESPYATLASKILIQVILKLLEFFSNLSRLTNENSLCQCDYITIALSFNFLFWIYSDFQLPLTYLFFHLKSFTSKITDLAVKHFFKRKRQRYVSTNYTSTPRGTSCIFRVVIFPISKSSRFFQLAATALFRKLTFTPTHNLEFVQFVRTDTCVHWVTRSSCTHCLGSRISSWETFPTQFVETQKKSKNLGNFG